MKLPSGINKWGAAVLGVVILVLVANLVAQYRDLEPRKSAAHFTPVHVPRLRAGKGSTLKADDLAQYDPAVHFDTLKTLDARPLPDEDRDPFGMQGQAAAPVVQAAAAPAAPVAPPPPPPLPLKAMGYNELPGGKKEAMITYNDDVVLAHEGDTIGARFKVVTIDPSKLVVEDGETHQTLELPFPQ